MTIKGECLFVSFLLSYANTQFNSAATKEEAYDEDLAYE